MLEKRYKLIEDFLTKDEIVCKYGKVSFAYLDKDCDRYHIIAISDSEPQYLKTDLLMDNVDFCGTDTLMDLEPLLGVI